MKRVAIFNIPLFTGPKALFVTLYSLLKKKKKFCAVSFLNFTEILPSFWCVLQCFIQTPFCSLTSCFSPPTLNWKLELTLLHSDLKDEELEAVNSSYYMKEGIILLLTLRIQTIQCGYFSPLWLRLECYFIYPKTLQEQQQK